MARIRSTLRSFDCAWHLSPSSNAIQSIRMVHVSQITGSAGVRAWRPGRVREKIQIAALLAELPASGPGTRRKHCAAPSYFPPSRCELMNPVMRGSDSSVASPEFSVPVQRDHGWVSWHLTRLARVTHDGAAKIAENVVTFLVRECGSFDGVYLLCVTASASGTPFHLQRRNGLHRLGQPDLRAPVLRPPGKLSRRSLSGRD